MSDQILNPAQIEAIEVANAHLNNVGLPTYSDLQRIIYKSVDQWIATGGEEVSKNGR